MKYTVTFQPDNTSIGVDHGANLLEAALEAGVHINATCGGQGVCGKCRVIIKSGDVESAKTEQISDEKYDNGWRQACKTQILSDCTVEIPVESRGLKGAVAQHLQMGKTDRKISALKSMPLAEDWDYDPLTVKFPLRLTPPTLQDNVSDLSRLISEIRQHQGIENLSVDLRCLRGLPEVLRENDWHVTATIMTGPGRDTVTWKGGEDIPLSLVRVEAGDAASSNLAVALDVGTTTICAQLIDLQSKAVLAERASYNRQMEHGDDVITRIVFSQKPGGRKKLQKLVVSSINHVIANLLEDTDIPKHGISCIVASGNTTMTHLLLDVEARYIREAPYVPVANFMPVVRAASTGMDVPNCVPLYTFPAVASYVGGDIVSGILGSGVFQKDQLTLYMDIGTNGEIVLGNKEWLACAACSMGPAFEGGGIQHGMRADRGAIEGFHINPLTLEPMLTTVNRCKPRGICGSGLISILAELLHACVINPRGQFSKELRSERIREGRFGYEYVLAWEQDSDIKDDIVITEVDIENLIRAKGALFAGCLTLLESLNLSFQDLDRVIIAGAFGRYINLEKGKQIGLFPDIPVEKFHFLGNGSLLGGQLVCLSKGMLTHVERIAKMMTNVELSDNASFMDKYMASLFLPHTEAGLFPKVSEHLKERMEIIEKERNAS
jgi:uncharacterized 2Fe-2S/4Fe-4S cluster protein (DUF4445 family)